MMDFINTNIVLLASASAGCCVFFSAYIIIDFMLFTGNRYKERFIQEAAVEMDDVLLQIPPGKVLDVSLAGSAISAFIVVGLLFVFANFQNCAYYLFVIIPIIANFAVSIWWLKYYNSLFGKK